MDDITGTILVVDDDLIDVIAIKRELAELKSGSSVVVAENGLIALQRLRGENGYSKVESPSVILLDLNMPEMGGIEFLHELRIDPQLRRIPVFVLSSSNNDIDKSHAYDMNIAGYIRKGLPGKRFADAIGMLACYVRVTERPLAGAG